MPEQDQPQTAANVFLIVSLLLVPILHYTGMTRAAIGPGIYVYFIFAIIVYQYLRNKHIFQMIKTIGMAPFSFCILLTPIYFFNHFLQGTLLVNAYTISDVLSAWFEVMLLVLFVGYMHVFVVLILYVLFYMFAGLRRL